MLYDVANKSGFLYHKINNEKKKNKPVAIDLARPVPEVVLSDEQKADLLHVLKQMIVQSNIDSLTSKLLESMRSRREIIANDLSAYLEACGFYFSAPRLVSGNKISCRFLGYFHN